MPTLPRLILISGWAHDAAAMEALRKNLENAADVHPVACGNLWSAETQAFTPSSYARNLCKMIEKIGGRVFIAGWSQGGMIALETAAYRPDLVAGLVLISSTAKFRTGPDWTSGVSGGALRAMTNMLKRDPRNVLATFFKNVAHTFEDQAQRLRANAESHGVLIQKLEETIALKIEKACAMNPLELSAGLEYLSEKDLRDEATKINIPALVLHGQEDALIPVEAGMALKSMLPISKIRVYEKCGHGLPWQNPRAIAEDIKGFLEECRGRKIHAVARGFAAGPAFSGKTNSLIAERFSAAAETYHRLADIQRLVAVKLMALISRRPAPSLILEVGCGTGLLTEMLSRAFQSSIIDAVDISPAMIKKARANLAGNKLVNWITADAEKFAEIKKYPLIVSNCALHWIAPIQLTIQKLGAMLEPDGTFAFAVMTRGTLSELNSSRNRIAPHKPPRVTLPAELDLRRAINKAGLTICVKISETIRHEYSSAKKMLKQLHDQGLTGGNNLHGGKLLTRTELSRLIADYSKNYKRKKEGNSVYASYRVFYCVAMKKAGTIKPIKSRGCHSRQSACGGLIGNPENR